MDFCSDYNSVIQSSNCDFRLRFGTKMIYRCALLRMIQLLRLMNCSIKIRMKRLHACSYFCTEVVTPLLYFCIGVSHIQCLVVQSTSKLLAKYASALAQLCRITNCGINVSLSSGYMYVFVEVYQPYAVVLFLSLGWPCYTRFRTFCAASINTL